MEAVKKRIDVLIPTYDPGIELLESSKRLGSQTMAVNRVIIINTGTETWAHSLPKYCEVQCIDKKDFDHGHTRNELVRLSDADYFICATQDIIPKDDKLIENLIAPMLEDERIKMTYARQLPAFDAGAIESISRSFNYPEESRVKTAADKEELGIKTYFASNVCAAYDRKTFDELGGFPDRTIFNEDMIYASRLINAGYAIKYCADARVIHSHNYTASQQFKRNFDNAVSQTQYAADFAGIKCESEGKKLVKYTAGRLFASGRFYLIPKLLWHSFRKYSGFRKGLKYKKLSTEQRKKYSMNPEYWDSQKED